MAVTFGTWTNPPHDSNACVVCDFWKRVDKKVENLMTSDSVKGEPKGFQPGEAPKGQKYACSVHGELGYDPTGHELCGRNKGQEGLRPCPFCGDNRVEFNSGYVCYRVDCGGRGPMYSDPEKALERWDGAYCWTALSQAQKERDESGEELVRRRQAMTIIEGHGDALDVVEKLAESEKARKEAEEKLSIAREAFESCVQNCGSCDEVTPCGNCERIGEALEKLAAKELK